MGKKWNKNYIQLGVVLTASICACILFYEVIKQWRSILGWFGKLFSAMTPVIIGLVIAFLINPIMIFLRRGITFLVSKHYKNRDYDAIYKKTKIPALILTVILFVGALTGFLYLVIPSLYTSIADLVKQMPDYLQSMQDWIDKMFSKNAMLEGRLSNIVNYLETNVFSIIQDKIMPNLDTIALKISSGVVVGVKAVFNFFVGLIVAIYLLVSKDTLIAQGKKMIYLIFSRKSGNNVMKALRYANSVFGGFINGKIIDSIIIGIFCFIFTSVIGMRYAVLISVIVGITNIIPFFGPFIGAVPGSLLALMDDPIFFVIFVVWIIVLQQFDGNILGPLILGDATGLSSIWILIAILVGGDMFGIVGMVIGVPIFACLYAFIAVQLRDGLRRKNLSSKTEDYYYLMGFDDETGEPVYAEKHEKRRSLRQMKRKMLFREKFHRKQTNEKWEAQGKDVITDEQPEASDDNIKKDK